MITDGTHGWVHAALDHVVQPFDLWHARGDVDQAEEGIEPGFEQAPVSDLDDSWLVAAPTLPPVPFQRSSDHYLLAAAPGTNCATNVSCEVPVRLEARAGFHINKEYPYKLEAQPAPGVVFANASGTFTRQSGDFTEQSENVAVMRVRFTATTPGRTAIRGVYNMSVCSASKCDLEKVPFAFEVPIR